MRISDWSSDVCSSDLSAASRSLERVASVAHFQLAIDPAKMRLDGVDGKEQRVGNGLGGVSGSQFTEHGVFAWREDRCTHQFLWANAATYLFGKCFLIAEMSTELVEHRPQGCAVVEEGA